MHKIWAAGGMLKVLKKIYKFYRSEGLKGLSTKIADKTGFFAWNYKKWIHRYDTLNDSTRARMRKKVDDFDKKPLISVIMPCFNPNPKWLKKAIESVRCQIYTSWELCIADDASTNPLIRAILEDYSRKDARIKVCFREYNGNISIASNSALLMASGEYTALLDHDDLLAEHAFFWIVEAINKNPDAGIVYSDEDKIIGDHVRLSPHFKCDWNYDLFLSQNLISHLGVYKTDLLRKIGGFRKGFEGSQDYDLALRCIEHLHPSQIIHVPRILYHWRIHRASTSMDLQAKPYAYEAAERALNEHLLRKGIKAYAERLAHSCSYRVHYALPETVPLVTLIILTRNNLHLIQKCINSILEKTNYANYEVIVVDNASDDPKTLEHYESLKSNPQIRIVHDDRPFNYSALNNSAVRLSRGEFVCLINNDIEVISSNWLSEMVALALQPGVGAVGARLWYPNNTLQHGGLILDIDGVAAHCHKYLPRSSKGYFLRAILQQSFSAVTGACLLVRQSIYHEVNGLDEQNLKIAFNDVDFCLRIKAAGYRNVWTPHAELYHVDSATRGYENTPAEAARFKSEANYMIAKWGSILMNDPAYSPNLTLTRNDFSYAWPPRVASIEDL